MKNWAGNVEFHPSRIVHPASVAEVSELILTAREENRRVRVVGSGHSFTRLIETPDILISLDEMQGVLSHEKTVVQVRGGTKLKRLGEELHALGLAQENLGDIDVQSIAGALSTGTHGTGANLGVIATQVDSLCLVNGLGERTVVTADKDPDLFAAARVSLGALGVIVEAGLKAAPAYRLAMEQKKGTLEESLENFESFNRDFRHFEFFWFPHSKAVLQKFTFVTDEDPRPVTYAQHFSEVVLENILFEGVSRVSRMWPSLAPRISRLCGAAASGNRRLDWSHRVFASPRWVKFVEMEYGVPLIHFRDVMREIEKEIVSSNHLVHFPIECRFVKGDDIWLSPAYGGDRAFISVHMYQGMAYREYFAALEKIFLRYGGRPHWGKLHTLKGRDLAPLYPRWSDFQRQREKHDPHGVFVTDYMREIWKD